MAILYVMCGVPGSGKSTLLKCMLGINKINNGTVNIKTNNSCADFFILC